MFDWKKSLSELSELTNEAFAHMGVSKPEDDNTSTEAREVIKLAEQSPKGKGGTIMSKIILAALSCEADRLTALTNQLQTTGEMTVKIVYRSKPKCKTHALEKQTSGVYKIGCSYADELAKIGETPKGQSNPNESYLFGNMIHKNTKTGLTKLRVFFKDGEHPSSVYQIDGKYVDKATYEGIYPPRSGGVKPICFDIDINNIISIEGVN